MKRSEILLFLALCVLGAGWAYQGRVAMKKAKATVVAYYIPESYSGWVTVKFNAKKSPPLPFTKKGDGGIYKIVIPENGVYLTSSPFYGEKHRTRYYRFGKKGARLLHEGGFGVRANTEAEKEYWVSGGSYNASFLQFYLFPKPVPLHTHPPEPDGKHRVAPS